MENQSWQRVEAWMGLYGDRIVRVVYLIIDDYQLAEEITQEVFVRAYHHLDSFRGESSPYTWLYQIALNLSKNYLNRKAKISFLPLTMKDKEPDVLAEPIEDKVVRLSISRKIRGCIKELPLKYREVIILHYYDDQKIAEIARVLKQPEGTIKSKLARGRELLEKIMRKEGLEYGQE